MLATAAVNAQMVIEIGQVYGCELNSDRGKELALSLGKTLVSLGVVKGAVDLLGKALQLNMATYLVGKVIQGVTAAYLTRIAGRSFVEYFRQCGRCHVRRRRAYTEVHECNRRGYEGPPIRTKVRPVCLVNRH